MASANVYNCPFCLENFADVQMISDHVCDREKFEKGKKNKWTSRMSLLLLSQYKEHIKKRRSGYTIKKVSTFRIRKENICN